VYIPKGLVEVHNSVSDTLAGHAAAHIMLSLVPQMGLGWNKAAVVLTVVGQGRKCPSLILMEDMLVGVKAGL